MYSGQEFAGRAELGLGPGGLGFLQARAGLKIRAECGLAGSASEVQEKTALLFALLFKKVANN